MVALKIMVVNADLPGTRFLCQMHLLRRRLQRNASVVTSEILHTVSGRLACSSWQTARTSEDVLVFLKAWTCLNITVAMQWHTTPKLSN